MLLMLLRGYNHIINSRRRRPRPSHWSRPVRDSLRQECHRTAAGDNTGTPHVHDKDGAPSFGSDRHETSSCCTDGIYLELVHPLPFGKSAGELSPAGTIYFFGFILVDFHFC